MSKKLLKSRPGAKNELWCSFLVPFAILCSIFHNSESGIHIALCIVGASLLVSLFCKAIHSTDKPLPTGYQYLYYTTYAVSILLLRYLTDYNFNVILPMVFMAFLDFEMTFEILLKTGCFSMGEAAIVAESSSLFLSVCSLSVPEVLNKTTTLTEVVCFTRFSQALILGCLALLFLLYHYPSFRSPLMFYCTCVSVAYGVFRLDSIYLKQNPIIWLFHTCIISRERVLLILSWVGLVVVAFAFAAYYVGKTETPSTVIRKYFHVIIITIYVPGLLVDPAFLYLASVVTLSVFIFLEASRVLLIPPVGTLLESVFSKFIDEKDSGVLILTNIYLLVGCSSPLWLYPPHNGLHLCHWSGIISVGLGDMIASAAGITFGKHKWQGSNKTIEGTICAAAAQFIVLHAILCIREILSAWNFIVILSASIATSIVEAKTTQVDNLILPLIMFPILFCAKV